MRARGRHPRLPGSAERFRGFPIPLCRGRAGAALHGAGRELHTDEAECIACKLLHIEKDRRIDDDILGGRVVPCDLRSSREERTGGGQISVLRAQAGVDIDARNSPLDFVFVKRLSNSSIASTVESGLKTLRSTQTRLSSSGGRSNSSFRVPER